MKVVCIFPVTGIPQNIPDILSKFEKKIAPGLCAFGAIKPEIKFAGTDYVFVPNEESLSGESKGKGILDCLKNLSKLPDFVIACDGSGKIPYEHIVDIFQELTSDSKTCCAMAKRGENKAISDFRYLIERFEIFTLKKYHNYEGEILDGQCGLWGFRYGKIDIDGGEKEIKLSGLGYEIELDLLGELLEKKLKYSFVNVELPKKLLKTAFDWTDSLKKMKFLIDKYSKFEYCIPEAFEEFEEEEEFKTLIKEKEIEYWKKYKKDILNIKKK